MSKGHGQIINLSNGTPFVFIFNPTKVDTTKKVNYFSAPNIGGAFHKKYFTGFDNKEVDFELICMDMENPLGVIPEINYFEQLREPDAGIIGIAGSFFGNANYPPPQVLFQFGVSMIPLVWDVMNVQIETDLFEDDKIGGVIGIPKRATIKLQLSLDEDNVVFKANQIARKVSAITGGLRSVQKEVLSAKRGTRKEQVGSSPARRLR